MYHYVVIDDEGLMRKGTIKKLAPIADLACCIGEASDGTEALELIARTNPEIIITDMHMPGMDGTELLPVLTERYPDKRIIIISGYKDFDYMKHALNAKAVDYILKPFGKEDIQKSLKDAIEQLETQADLTNRLVTSEARSEAARYEHDIQMLKNYILGYHTDHFSITSDKLNFINQTHDIILIALSSSSVLEEGNMQQFLSENGFGDLALYLQHTHHKNLGFLALFIPGHAPLKPLELCRQVTQSLNLMFDALHIQVSYGVSSPHQSLTELHDLFIETVSALNAKSPKDTARLLFYQGLPSEARSYVWENLPEFLFRIEAGMPVQTEELLTQLFEDFAQHNSLTLYDIKMYCFWLSDQARYILSEYLEQVNPESANSSMQNVINCMFHLTELRQYYLQYFHNIASILQKQGVYDSDDPIEKMQTYIRRHYQNDLTIEFLSSLFYMNRSYCSHLFKERTGDTFVNYLNSVRLSHAKQLLTETDKKMYQIAKQTGYDNVKYFFRVFKKYEQMTPEQYRNKN